MLDNKRILVINTICLVYLTMSLACDMLAYRLISFFGHTLAASALLYIGLFALLDLLAKTCGRKFTIISIFIFHACDLLFTYFLFWINKISYPHNFYLIESYNHLFNGLPILFWSGILGAIAAGIIEVLFYSFVQKRVKSFFVSSYFSTIIVVLVHNAVTEYFTINKAFPGIYPKILFINISIIIF